jgi:hypothetical protein
LIEFRRCLLCLEKVNFPSSCCTDECLFAKSHLNICPLTGYAVPIYEKDTRWELSGSFLWEHELKLVPEEYKKFFIVIPQTPEHYAKYVWKTYERT